MRGGDRFGISPRPGPRALMNSTEPGDLTLVVVCCCRLLSNNNYTSSRRRDSAPGRYCSDFLFSPHGCFPEQLRAGAVSRRVTGDGRPPNNAPRICLTHAQLHVPIKCFPFLLFVGWLVGWKLSRVILLH